MADNPFDFLVADDSGDVARNQKAVVGAFDGLSTAGELADDALAEHRKKRRPPLWWLGTVFWIALVAVLAGGLSYALFAA